MERLRRAHRLVWFALAWLALSIGAAAASAAIHPLALELICSVSHGNQMVVAQDDGGEPAAGHHHVGDCPLCVTAGAPPPVTGIAVPHQVPAAAPTPWLAEYVAAFGAAPPPARGPPSTI